MIVLYILKVTTKPNILATKVAFMDVKDYEGLNSMAFSSRLFLFLGSCYTYVLKGLFFVLFFFWGRDDYNVVEIPCLFIFNLNLDICDIFLWTCERKGGGGRDGLRSPWNPFDFPNPPSSR